MNGEASADIQLEALLDDLVDEFTERLNRGEQPNVEEYAARHPEAAATIRHLLGTLKAIRQASQSASSLSAAENVGGSVAGQLGDFRIVRELGRGGMGVVYEAEQISLGRRVALKVLPFAAALDTKQLQRFKNEAQAAAHLHHQNIVPVYYVGSERGVHFYAMQFIEGQTLAAVIHELRQLAGLEADEKVPSLGAPSALASQLASGRWAPHQRPPLEEEPTRPSAQPSASRSALNTQHSALPATAPMAALSTERSIQSRDFFRTAANLGVQAAEALEHAHQMGIVHRDIKPGNLLVDIRGKPWISDFGLAHCQSQAGLTMTGDLVGTLRYMSPEQALAQRVVVDHRTDIYSLGATLYELLTLEPAFTGRDRQELLQQIAFEEPRSPRRLNAAVPFELETIVLKALEKRPNERYATGQELADDLRRFLEDKPIRAKRPTLFQKVKKLARRNRPVVWTALATLAVSLIVTAGVAIWDAVRLGDQLQQTRKAEEKATYRLYRSLVEQARASRVSGRMGRRFHSLELLAEAAKLAREAPLDEQETLELRNETIACLALLDLRVDREWDGFPLGSTNLEFDGSLARYVRTDLLGNISVRRVADDAPLYEFASGLRDPGLRFSPDGQFLMVWHASQQQQVWRLVGKEPVAVVRESGGQGLAFSPDSRQFALGRADGTITLIDLWTGLRLKEMKAQVAPRILAFHPTQRQLAVGDSNRLEVLDLETGAILARLPVWVAFNDMTWHPDGKSVATPGDDRVVYWWDIATGKQLARLEGNKHVGILLTFNHAGNLLASVSWDGRMYLWDPRTGQQLFSTPAGWHYLHFSPDDRLLASGIDGAKLKLWEVAPSCGYRTLVRDPVLGKPPRHEGCAVSPKAPLLAVAMSDGLVGLWDLTDGHPLTFLPAEDAHTVLFERTGQLLTNGPSGVREFPIEIDSTVPSLIRIGKAQKLPLPGSQNHFASSADGQVLAVSGRHPGALVWHRNLGKPPIPLTHEDARSVAVSPDGVWVATGSHGASLETKVWKASDGALVKSLPSDRGNAVGFSPDGHWLATAGGGGVRLWRVPSWEEGPQIAGNWCAFSPDSRILAVVTGDGAIGLVNPATGHEYARLEDPFQGHGAAATFSPDGTQLVVNDFGQLIHVWDLRAIREQLAERGLDWDLPPYPPKDDAKAVAHLRVDDEYSFGLWEFPSKRPYWAGALGRWDIAAYDFSRLVQLDPKNAVYQNDLAWLRANCPDPKQRDLAQALEMAKKAVTLSPDRAPMHHTLGVAYYRVGAWKEAIAALQTSRELRDGGDSYEAFFLAMAHWQMGRKDEAQRWYAKAVQWIEEHEQHGLNTVDEKDKELELRSIRTEAAELLGTPPRAPPRDRDADWP
jgi:serine/threonine protein kinase/WD40 repeat protein